MSKSAITKEGEVVIKKRLAKLKFEERPKISEAIAEARAHGDLKENAEYHAAKELQGLVEAKIQEIETSLANAQVIDVKTIPETGRATLYDYSFKNGTNGIWYFDGQWPDGTSWHFGGAPGELTPYDDGVSYGSSFFGFDAMDAYRGDYDLSLIHI